MPEASSTLSPHHTAATDATPPFACSNHTHSAHSMHRHNRPPQTQNPLSHASPRPSHIPPPAYNTANDTVSPPPLSPPPNDKSHDPASHKSARPYPETMTSYDNPPNSPAPPEAQKPPAPNDPPSPNNDRPSVPARNPMGCPPRKRNLLPSLGQTD